MHLISSISLFALFKTLTAPLKTFGILASWPTLIVTIPELRRNQICQPLLFDSLISGMASIPSKAAGKLGGYAVLYYLITTFMAVLLGILLVSTIKPGNKGVDRAIKVNKNKLVEPVDAILDLIR